jgi:hypothetical protein
VEQTSLHTSSIDRANKKLINASVYLSQYNIKVHHLAGKLNLVPDALSPLQATGDMVDRPDGTATLDDVWFAWTEALMDPAMVVKFVAAYRKDPKLAAIIAKIRKPTKIKAKPAKPAKRGAKPTNEDVDILFRAGYPFHIAKKNGLLYNHRIDGTYTFCIPHGMVGTILATAYDANHHYGRDCMIYELRDLPIHVKTHQVK